MQSSSYERNFKVFKCFLCKSYSGSIEPPHQPPKKCIVQIYSKRRTNNLRVTRDRGGVLSPTTWLPRQRLVRTIVVVMKASGLINCTCAKVHRIVDGKIIDDLRYEYKVPINATDIISTHIYRVIH